MISMAGNWRTRTSMKRRVIVFDGATMQTGTSWTDFYSGKYLAVF
jgi:hypothetical protein